MDISIIKEFEGFSPKAYVDPLTKAEPITIGYGTTRYITQALINKFGRTKVLMGDVITEPEALAELTERVADYKRQVLAQLTVTLSDNELAALVSFVYNLGLGGSAKQIARLNAGKKQEFADMLLEYINKGSNVEAGLLRRRKAERELFLKGGDVRTDVALLTKTGKKYGAEWSGLEELILKLGDKSWRVASGVPGRQTFRKAEDPKSLPGSLEPIPQGSYILGPVEWAGGKGNWSATWGSAFGPIWQELRNGQPMRRGAFGIHMDGNMPRSPGSAGCVVWYVKTELEEWIEEFEKHKPKELLADWGL